MEKAQRFFYFKPLLIRNGSVEWPRGENYLAIATSGAPLEIHPYFLDDGHRSVCELMRPLASPAGMEHRFRVFLPLGNPENTLKRYPVLYMHDRNNLFPARRSVSRQHLEDRRSPRDARQDERVAAEPKRELKIYLDSGWPRDDYEATRSMRDRLIWKGYRPGSDLFYLAFPNARHDENSWAERSPIPFQFLFGNQPHFFPSDGALGNPRKKNAR